MKVNPAVKPAVAPATPKSSPAAPAAADAPLSTDGLKQLEKFVLQIHAAVDVQVAALGAKGKEIPPLLHERKVNADQLLEAARSGHSMSAGEVAAQLNGLLWDLNPAQLTQLHDGLTATAEDFGELAKLQGRILPGLPATMGSVVDLLSGASKVPTTVKDADRMLGDVAKSLEKNPQIAERLNAQRDLLMGLKEQLVRGEAILKPLSLPTTQAGAKEAVTKVTEQLGALHGDLAALLGDKQPAELQGEAKTKFEKLSGEALRVGEDLATLQAYSAQLDGFAEPTAVDKTGVLFGLSVGPAWDLARWIPGFPVPVYASVGAGLHLFEKDRATGDRKLDWYGAANLQTPFGAAGYAISPSKKGFSAAFNPPLGTKLGISLATHPFHGRKLDVFIPGVFRAEATSTGALALTLFVPVPIPGFKLGATLLVRNPVLANITGPILWAMDKTAQAANKVYQTGKEVVKDAWDAMTQPIDGLPPTLPPMMPF